MQQHERQQSLRLRFARHQSVHQASQANSFSAKFAPYQRIACACVVAFVEDEIHDQQNRLHAVGQFLVRGNAVGNPCVPNFLLRAHQPLRHGGDRDQKRVRDFLRAQSAQRSQGQRHLRLPRQCRMAARKDQPQPVIFEHGFFRHVGHLLGQRVQACQFVAL